MTIDELINEWEVDANIDSEHLDTSSATSPKLHAKYLRIFMDTKLRITKTQNQYDTLSEIRLRLTYLETMLTVIESILGQIKGRDWQIKNILNWRQFMAGQ